MPDQAGACPGLAAGAPLGVGRTAEEEIKTGRMAIDEASHTVPTASRDCSARRIPPRRAGSGGG